MSEEEQVPKKKIIGGKGKLSGVANGGAPFPKDQAYLTEAKKAGWAKKRLLKSLLNIVTTQKFNKGKTDYRKLASQFFGIPMDEVTIETMMDFCQIEKSINLSDTNAYVAIKDRVYGRPHQKTDITSNDEKLGSNLSPEQFAILLNTVRERTLSSRGK